MEDSEIQEGEKSNKNPETNLDSDGKKNANGAVSTCQDDPELDDLLDSALADFDKAPVAAASDNASKLDEAGAGSSSKPDTTGATLPPDQEAMFNEIFRSELADDTTKHFEDAMKALQSEDPNMYEQLTRLSQAANNIGDSTDTQKEFFGSLQETLGNLAANAQDLQGELSEDDLARAMSSLGLDTSAEGQGQEEFFPMMQTMMKSLLSKEILYPSLKEISQKYPAWLEDHKEDVDSEQYDKYSQQYQLMKEICGELEQEKEEDDDDMKRQRFEKILSLMQQMQECGQPPPDIVGEMAPGLEFDENGIPRLPGASEQCCVM